MACGVEHDTGRWRTSRLDLNSWQAVGLDGESVKVDMAREAMSLVAHGGNAYHLEVLIYWGYM